MPAAASIFRTLNIDKRQENGVSFAQILDMRTKNVDEIQNLDRNDPDVIDDCG